MNRRSPANNCGAFFMTLKVASSFFQNEKTLNDTYTADSGITARDDFRRVIKTEQRKLAPLAFGISTIKS